MTPEERHTAQDLVQRQTRHQAIVNVASLAPDAATAKVLLQALGLDGEVKRSLIRLRGRKKRSA